MLKVLMGGFIGIACPVSSFVFFVAGAYFGSSVSAGVVFPVTFFLVWLRPLSALAVSAAAGGAGVAVQGLAVQGLAVLVRLLPLPLAF